MIRLAFLLVAAGTVFGADFQAGVAKVKITPEGDEPACGCSEVQQRYSR